MVSFGSKGLPLRRRPDHTSANYNTISGENKGYKQERRKRSMGRKADKKHSSSDGTHQPKGASGSKFDGPMKDKKFSKKQDYSESEMLCVRKQVDSETAKYFSEITNVLESGELDLEERSVICGNALEESKGKEVELSTDYVLSHTMQSLLDGCNADHLCCFLRGCAEDFARISTDRSGSHVAETALSSLARHLNNESCYSLIEDTLSSICQAIIRKPIDMMCNCYGSHVFRTLLCLCKGVPSDSDIHGAKSSSVLARRLNISAERERLSNIPFIHQGFPDLLQLVVSKLLKCTKGEVAILQTDQYSSLVFQTALKLLKGQDQDLFYIIPFIMGCNVTNAEEGNFIEMSEVQNIRDLMNENAFSHLMEVILEVCPDILYDEIFMKVFKDWLYDISRHQSANFAVQALISHARSPSQIDAICDELAPKLKSLLEISRSGVVASLVAACQRLHASEHKCSKALTAAIISADESPKCVVPRLLLLENFLFSNDKSSWSWRSGCKVHVIGSLILQSLFKYPRDYIESYITSITSMDSSHLVETVKDSVGARVIEAFLASTATDKQKKILISKLKGHFGELAMQSSGSFTVEKCFNTSDVALREVIVSELLGVHKELSKTRQGPVLLRNLDVDGFSRRPEQWKSHQKSKISVHKEYLAEFGPREGGSSQSKNLPTNISKKPAQNSNIKQMRKEIDNALSSFGISEASNGRKKQKKSNQNHVDTNVGVKPSKEKKKRKGEEEVRKSSKKKMKA